MRVSISVIKYSHQPGDAVGKDLVGKVAVVEYSEQLPGLHSVGVVRKID